MAWTAEQMAQKRAKLQNKKSAAADGAQPLSQRKSADSRNPLALGKTENFALNNESGTWTADKMAAKRAALQAAKSGTSQTAQKQQAAAEDTDLRTAALADYRAKNNLSFADEMDSRSDTLNQQKVTNRDIYKVVNDWKDASDRNRQLANLVTETTLPTGAVSAADLPAGVDFWPQTPAGWGQCRCWRPPSTRTTT